MIPLPFAPVQFAIKFANGLRLSDLLRTYFYADFYAVVATLLIL